jgi:hypothetical protein
MTIDEFLEIVKNEGDYHEWIFTCENGCQFECMIRRNKSGGYNWCGYVKLTPDNKFYGIHYDSCSFDVHGGLTFSDEVDGHWLLGFDCAHSGDFTFYGELFHLNKNDTYRDKDYVMSETNYLAEQLSKYSKSIDRINTIDNILK